MSALRGRALLAVTAVLAFVVAACTPVVLPSTGPATTTSTTTTTAPPDPCQPGGSSLQAQAPVGGVEYSAVIDPGGDGVGRPEFVAFSARTQAEKKSEISELEAGSDEVVDVGPAAPVQALVTPGDDPRYTNADSGQPQNVPLQFVKADGAWATYDGTGVTIAIVDSGVQANHPDLAANVLTGRDFVGSFGDAGCPFDGVDPFGHGTHVAGTAAAADNTIGGLGAAPSSKILPVRVLNSVGQGDPIDVARGIAWAADNGADVINLSLGGTGSDVSIESAIDYAVNTKGVLVVAAAGNCGQPSPSTSCPPSPPTNPPIYPAALDPVADGVIVIAVGALKSSWASQTPTEKSVYSNPNTYVDVAAPGNVIDSTLKNLSYGASSGTSMATPFVSAVVALLLQKCPATTPAQALTKLKTLLAPSASGFADDPNVKVLDAIAVTNAAC